MKDGQQREEEKPLTVGSYVSEVKTTASQKQKTWGHRNMFSADFCRERWPIFPREFSKARVCGPHGLWRKRGCVPRQAQDGSWEPKTVREGRTPATELSNRNCAGPVQGHRL